MDDQKKIYPITQKNPKDQKDLTDDHRRPNGWPEKTKQKMTQLDSTDDPKIDQRNNQKKTQRSNGQSKKIKWTTGNDPMNDQ